DAARLLSIRARTFKLRQIPGDSEELRESCARRSADRRHVFLLHFKPGGICPQKSHGSLHVIERQRKLEHGCEPVIYGRRHVAVLGQPDRHRQIRIALAAAESPTMNQDYARMLARSLRTNYIHCQLAMREGSVVDAALHVDVCRDLQIRRPAQGSCREEEK